MRTALRGLRCNAAPGEVLPDTVTSRVTFTDSAGGPMAVDLVTRVAVAVRIIDADNPRKKDRVLLSRFGDGLLVTVGGYDPDLDVSRARYEFLDGRGALIGDAIEIDLVDAIRTSGMARVQSFKLEQRCRVLKLPLIREDRLTRRLYTAQIRFYESRLKRVRDCCQFLISSPDFDD